MKNYFLGFPAKIQAVLEPIKLQADLKYRLTGHAHPIDARDAALRYFTHTYCQFEAGLWRAVEKGDLLYQDITPHLDRLRNKLVSDVFTRANVGRCREPGSMWGYLGTFSGLADQALEESSQWRAVVKKRGKLATLATNPAPPVASSSSAPTPPVAATGVRLPDERVPLTITECAGNLGVSDDTIRRMIDDGKLATITVNRRRKIPQAELDRLRLAAPEKYRDKRRR